MNRFQNRVLLNISIFLLLSNFVLLVFNKYLYLVLPNPTKHFARKHHIAKELAQQLHTKNINKIYKNASKSWSLPKILIRCHSPRYSHQVKWCKTKNMAPPKNQIKSTTCKRCRNVVEQSHLFNQRKVANVCGGKDDRGT